jgi:hypothetical protein
MMKAGSCSVTSEGLRVTLGPVGLRVHLPSGRSIDLSATSAGVKFLEKMLRDAAVSAPPQRGYIGPYPTQAIAEAWERAERERERKAEEEREARWPTIDHSKIVIDL